MTKFEFIRALILTAKEAKCSIVDSEKVGYDFVVTIDGEYAITDTMVLTLRGNIINLPTEEEGSDDADAYFTLIAMARALSTIHDPSERLKIDKKIIKSLVRNCPWDIYYTDTSNIKKEDIDRFINLL